jgi:pimeloyl-ACP methyl ester carboxylesterase
MDDVRAVIDAAGSESAALYGYSEGGPLCILFAATYPERVRALVLYGAYATRIPTRTIPGRRRRGKRSATPGSSRRRGGTIST